MHSLVLLTWASAHYSENLPTVSSFHADNMQLKDAMPVSFDRNCLHLMFSTLYCFNHTWLSSEFYFHKYDKLPNIAIHACLNITVKTTL